MKAYVKHENKKLVLFALELFMIMSHVNQTLFILTIKYNARRAAGLEFFDS